METRLKGQLKTRLIIYLLEELPFGTPQVFGRQLFTRAWFNDVRVSLKTAQYTLNRLKNEDRIKSVKYRDKVYVAKGKDPYKGFGHFEHDEGVIEVLINAHLYGYDTEWGSGVKSDGMIGEFPLELDCGNKDKNALKKQLEKYEDAGYEYILIVSYPKSGALKLKRYDRQYQNRQSEKIRKQISGLNFNRKFRKKFLFATFLDASDPRKDPLTKIWKRIDGKFISLEGKCSN